MKCVSFFRISVSLDPDEDKRDATIFEGLKIFMLNEMTDEECQYFKTVTLRNLAKRAQSLKSVRPPRGLSFSLQQQRMYMEISTNCVIHDNLFMLKRCCSSHMLYFFSCFCLSADKVKLSYDLVAALLANAFFSTFPKRTEKTHPTLQDFNFSFFFRHLNE